MLKIMMHQLKLRSSVLREEAMQPNEGIFREFSNHVGSSESPASYFGFFGDPQRLYAAHRLFSGVNNDS